MSRIMFRQKTPEEIAAEATAKIMWEACTAKITEQSSASAPIAEEAVVLTNAVVEPGFALDSHQEASHPGKGRRQ